MVSVVYAGELPVLVRSVFTSRSHYCWIPDLALVLLGRAGQGLCVMPLFSVVSMVISKGIFFCFFVLLQARLNCKHCGKPVIDVRIGMQYFSEYSNVQQCPHCGNLDYHLVKPFSSFKVLEAY